MILLYMQLVTYEAVYYKPSCVFRYSPSCNTCRSTSSWTQVGRTEPIHRKVVVRKEVGSKAGERQTLGPVAVGGKTARQILVLAGYGQYKLSASSC